MRTEVPMCTRCCFCLPLRYGLLTWVYLKLAAAVIVLIALLVTLSFFIVYYRNLYVVPYVFCIGMFLVLLLIDIALNLVFIIGGHTKNVSLLRVYYIYSIILWVLTIILVLVTGVIMMPTIFSHRTWLTLLDFTSSFVNVVMQSYFILLLRSEINKLKSNCTYRFVNNAAEAECALQYKEELLVYKEEGIRDVGEKETCERKTVCAKTCQTNGTCHI